MNDPYPKVNFVVLTLILCFGVATALQTNDAMAEYGDIVMNNYSDDGGIRPVIFPHWFHRIRYRCKICHSDLGFKLQAGASEINMLKIINGEFCGACHNGEVAWSIENCEICHTALPGTPTQVHNSTIQLLVAPKDKPKQKTKK